MRGSSIVVTATASGIFVVLACIGCTSIKSGATERSAGAIRTDSGSVGRLRSGRERILYVIGSSSCGASGDPEVPVAIARIQRLERLQAKKNGYRLASVGVATDWDLNKGLAFLNEVGTFDEISIGRSWSNGTSVEYLWRDNPGVPAIPQIVIVERDVEVGEDAITIGRDTVVARKIGVDEIIRYSEKLETRK